MKVARYKKTLYLILCLALLLSAAGCTTASEKEVIEQATQTDPPEYQPTNGSDESTEPADSVFSLLYDPEFEFNPISGSNSYNMTAASLVYETLFVLDNSFQPQPLLCEKYTTSDGITFTLNIKNGVTFQDGSAMTADDVVYSIVQAEYSEKYSNRLSGIIEVVATDEYTVSITLDSANYLFASRLDIPVIQSGSIDEARPLGTGPYSIAEDAGTLQLNAYSGHRDAAELPLDTIYLVQLDENGLTDNVLNGRVDFLAYDPTGISRVNLQSKCDLHCYNSPTLQYIGFNMNNLVLSDGDVRRAVSAAIDRDDIVQSVMDSRATATSVIISPDAYFYSDTFASGTGYSETEMKRIFNDLGMKDSDHDGFLEYGGAAFSLDFIVNSENPYKVRAAENISETLRDAGINVTLRTLSWDEYNAALTSGDFDIYYAEVRLTADFDPSALFASGGALNYGGIDNLEYDTYISGYLGASTSAEQAKAASDLCQYVSDCSHIVPILYKQYSALSGKNTISGIDPTQTNIFNNITKWTVEFQ